MQNIKVTQDTSYTVTLNTSYIFTVHGGIKILQFILGLVCTLIIVFSHNHSSSVDFFLIVAITFLIGTFCHIFAEMFSSKNMLSGLTESTKIFRSHASEMVYGYVYNGLAAILYIISSAIVLSISNKILYVGSIIGLVNGIFYLIATIINGKF